MWFDVYIWRCNLVRLVSGESQNPVEDFRMSGEWMVFA